jgi:hypothetical protein
MIKLKINDPSKFSYLISYIKHYSKLNQSIIFQIKSKKITVINDNSEQLLYLNVDVKDLNVEILDGEDESVSIELSSQFIEEVLNCTSHSMTLTIEDSIVKIRSDKKVFKSPYKVTHYQFNDTLIEVKNLDTKDLEQIMTEFSAIKSNRASTTAVFGDKIIATSLESNSMILFRSGCKYKLPNSVEINKKQIPLKFSASSKALSSFFGHRIMINEKNATFCVSVMNDEINRIGFKRTYNNMPSLIVINQLLLYNSKITDKLESIISVLLSFSTSDTIDVSDDMAFSISKAEFFVTESNGCILLRNLDDISTLEVIGLSNGQEVYKDELPIDSTFQFSAAVSHQDIASVIDGSPNSFISFGLKKPALVLESSDTTTTMFLGCYINGINNNIKYEIKEQDTVVVED